MNCVILGELLPLESQVRGFQTEVMGRSVLACSILPWRRLVLPRAVS